jgi:quinol monooxygenase YgiN
VSLIILAGWVEVDPERREEALAAGAKHMKATRQLEGCLDYVWSGDPLIPGRIVIFERWESRAHLENHFASPHYPAMRDTIASFGLSGLDVSKYRIDVHEPIYDPTGKPRADFFTV